MINWRPFVFIALLALAWALIVGVVMLMLSMVR